MTERTGGCACGAVRYSGPGPATHATICHCDSCRRASGAPLVAWITVPRDSFRFTAGTPRHHRSSPGVTRQFCGTCGTPLTYARDDLPAEIDVTVGSLDLPQDHPPEDQTQTRDKLPWIDTVSRLPEFAGARDETDAAYSSTRTKPS